MTVKTFTGNVININNIVRAATRVLVAECLFTMQDIEVTFREPVIGFGDRAIVSACQ